MHTDHTPYFGYTPKSRLDKAVKSLVGIIEGITIDQVLNEKELSFLSEWIQENQELKDRHPFNELIPGVYAAFEDHIVTDDEKSDLMWLCSKLTKTTEFYDQVTSDIQRLHGLLGGIIADSVITETELLGLREWLTKHEHLKSRWPYDEIDSIITAVMSDGKIDEEEHKILSTVFMDFISVYDDKTISSPPINIGSTIKGLCAVCPEIRFEGATFCFTGASSKYNRHEFERLVVSLGGRSAKNINKSVDYLIIGADGNPCWAYACYGRKVEAAVSLRKEGHSLVLVHENDFHDAVADIT
jgi:hypothetical protein